MENGKTWVFKPVEELRYDAILGFGRTQLVTSSSQLVSPLLRINSAPFVGWNTTSVGVPLTS